MTKLIAALCFGLALSTNPALAHGPDGPKHDGVVATAADHGFELAAKGDTATLYVEDHGKPVASEGMSGKLTVLTGTAKSEAALAPAGGNRLEAKSVTLAAGSKVVATLTMPDKQVVTVRFSIK